MPPWAWPPRPPSRPPSTGPTVALALPTGGLLLIDAFTHLDLAEKYLNTPPLGAARPPPQLKAEPHPLGKVMGVIPPCAVRERGSRRGDWRRHRWPAHIA
eukprot:CAMPEP_0185297732 /NCGR_PEP_ID=MMETSP1363-20130426/10058_1 /TAXON_ID=38817 /ORGANISM="Gephyrocapsa oceanica, Strain RCC1303" /LENGTH=99 /DNA_ID=CAMNT_0027894503 /DNA_START=153 /DNA_END=451 /DNA_ORIENTATION=+